MVGIPTSYSGRSGFRSLAGNRLSRLNFSLFLTAPTDKCGHSSYLKLVQAVSITSFSIHSTLGQQAASLNKPWINKLTTCLCLHASRYKINIQLRKQGWNIHDHFGSWMFHIRHTRNHQLLNLISSFIFWNTTPCGPVKVNWRFGVIYRLYHMSPK